MAEIESLSDALRALPGGFALAASLAPLDSSDVRSDHDLLEVVAAWERVISWAQEAQLAAIAEFVRRPVIVGTDPHAGWAARAGAGQMVREFADDELAARLSTSRVAAATRIDIGLSLARSLPATREALATGRVDLARARVIIDETRHLDIETAGEVERLALVRAPEQNCGRLRESVRRAAIAADPAAARSRAVKAKLERRVVIRPLPDEMAELWAVLPAPQAIAIDTALTAIARATKARCGRAEPRTVDQLRADALVAPFDRAIRTGVAPRGGEFADLPLATVRGSRAQLNVTVPASVLLGISDHPGHLAGYGPITADTARLIAGDATWRRLLTDPTSGTVLDVGTTTYRPPAAPDRHVKTRDGRCRGAGCNWPARLCETDHTIPAPKGPTAAHNLGALCKRHHVGKSAPGRTLRQVAPGVFRWTMPTGHTYTVHPDAVAPPLADELAVRAVRDVRNRKPPAKPPDKSGTPPNKQSSDSPGKPPKKQHIGRRDSRSPCRWARHKRGPAP